jgi:malonyl-CoA O-methyltransferase
VKVAASFSRAAEGYAEHARVQRAMADWLAEWLPEARRGAGTGEFTRRALPWTGRYVATDLAAGMCAAGARAVPGAEWREASADCPPTGRWDWVFSASMLQWVANPEPVLRAWRQELVPGGRMLAGLFVAETLPELRDLLGGWSPVPWRTAAEWRAAAEAAGWRLRRETVERRAFAYASAQALLRSVHGVGAAPERRQSTGPLRRWLKAQGEGPMHATWTFYRFEAEGKWEGTEANS